MSSFTLAVDVWMDKVLFECDGSLPESFITVIMSATALSHCTDCSSSLAMSSAWSEKDIRRTRPIFRSVMFLVAFGVVGQNNSRQGNQTIDIFSMCECMSLARGSNKVLLTYLLTYLPSLGPPGPPCSAKHYPIVCAGLSSGLKHYCVVRMGQGAPGLPRIDELCNHNHQS